VHTAIRAHLGSPQVARVIYGSIIGLALVLVLDAHGATAGEALGSLLVTAFAVAVAELFSEVIGAETRHRRWLERAELRHIAGEAGAVAFGIAFPAAFFVLAAAGAIELDTAFTLATWSGLGLIALYGFAAARLAGEGLPASLLHAFAVGLVGGFLIVMKALIH
jgi:hypothetical protein